VTLPAGPPPSGPPPSGPPPSGPPPGWYPDPEGHPGYRWWNGIAWTEDRSGGTDDGRSLLAIGDLLGETFRTLGQRIGHLFTLAVVLVVIPTAVGLGVIYAALEGLAYRDGTWSGVRPGWLAAAGVANLVLFLSGVAHRAAVGRQGFAALEGTPEPWSDSLRGGLRRTPRAVGANLAVWVPAVIGATVVWVVVGAVAPVLLLLVFPTVLGALVALWVRTGLVTTAAAVGAPGVGAIRSSFTATSGRFWAFLGRFLLLGILYWAVQVGGSTATAPVAGLSGAPSDAVVVDDETGAIEVFDVGALVTDNLGVLGFTILVSGLVQAAASSVTALGRASLFRSAGGTADPALSGD
jgi:hypothetical protein